MDVWTDFLIAGMTEGLWEFWEMKERESINYDNNTGTETLKTFQKNFAQF